MINLYRYTFIKLIRIISVDDVKEKRVMQVTNTFSFLNDKKGEEEMKNFKNKGGRLLSAFISLAVVFTITQINISANEETFDYNIDLATVSGESGDGYTLKDHVLTLTGNTDETYHLQGNGGSNITKITTANKLVVTLDGITLNGYLDITNTGTLVLKEQTINTIVQTDILFGAVNFGTGGTINGGGRLNVTARQTAIGSAAIPLIIENVEIYATSSESNGMTPMSLQVHNNAIIHAKGKKEGIGCYVTQIDGDNAVVIAEGETSGIRAMGLLVKNGSLTASSSNGFGINITQSGLEFSGLQSVIKASGKLGASNIKPTVLSDGITAIDGDWDSKDIEVSWKHVHSANTDWLTDADNHWHTCISEDDAVLEKAAHTYGEWVIDQAATESAEGSKHRACTICGHDETLVIPKIEASVKPDSPKDDTVVKPEEPTQQVKPEAPNKDSVIKDTASQQSSLFLAGIVLISGFVGAGIWTRKKY